MEILIYLGIGILIAISWFIAFMVGYFCGYEHGRKLKRNIKLLPK